MTLPIKSRLLAALAMCAVLASSALPLRAGSHITIQGIEAGTDHPAIKVNLTVKLPRDAGSTPLAEDHFQVYEDGFLASRLKLQQRGGGQDYFCLVFSFDSSKSIGKSLMSRMKKSAREIIAGTSPGDKIALYRFNDSVILLSDFTSPRSELLKNLEGIQRHGNRTLLYNAIYDSLERLKKEPAGRKAVIVFTDGRDEGSSFTTDDVIRSSRAADIPVHFICPAAVCNDRPLGRIARLSGGRLINSEAPGCASGILGAVPRSPDRELVLQYTSGLQPDDKFHQLEVRLRHPAVTDRDTRSFRLERTASDIRIPNISEIMLISLILVLIVLLAVVIVIIIRNSGRILALAPAAPRTEESFSFSIDRLERSDARPTPPTLTPLDPEYAYSKAWLLEKDGPETGKKFPIFWEELTLGRDEGNTIVVKDQAVSLKHAKIKRIKDTYLLYDLVSENGTLLNDKKLLRPKALYDWDEIRIGRTVFIFRGSKIQE